MYSLSANVNGLYVTYSEKPNTCHWQIDTDITSLFDPLLVAQRNYSLSGRCSGYAIIHYQVTHVAALLLAPSWTRIDQLRTCATDRRHRHLMRLTRIIHSSKHTGKKRYSWQHMRTYKPVVAGEIFRWNGKWNGVFSRNCCPASWDDWAARGRWLASGPPGPGQDGNPAQDLSCCRSVQYPAGAADNEEKQLLRQAF